MRLSDFLKQNKIYFSFLRNFYISNSKPIDEPLSIANAFHWDKTTQGLSFWLDVVKKWSETKKEDRKYDLDYLIDLKQKRIKNVK